MKIVLLLVMTTMLTVEPLGALATELTSLSPGRNEVQVKHDGRSRRLIITTPKTFGGQRPYPVLFCFHGAGGKAEGQSDRWSPHADKHGLIVISAEAVQSLKKWNIMDKFHAEDHDDVGFVSKVVEVLIANKIADDKAIFATGHSSGGLFSYRLAKETDLFAAVSPMSCGMIKGAHGPDERLLLGESQREAVGSHPRRSCDEGWRGRCCRIFHIRELRHTAWQQRRRRDLRAASA